MSARSAGDMYMEARAAAVFFRLRVLLETNNELKLKPYFERKQKAAATKTAQQCFILFRQLQAYHQYERVYYEALREFHLA